MNFLKKESKKVLFFLFVLFFSCSIFGVSAVKGFQNQYYENIGEEIAFTDTIKVLTTKNHDSENEIKFKNKSASSKIGNFTLYYDPKLEQVVSVTEKAIKEAEELAKKKLGKHQEKPVDILFMETTELMHYSELKDISGYYSDFDKIIAIGLTPYDTENLLKKNAVSSYQFEQTMVHEYTHYATYRILEEENASINDFPAWFVEGIADYVENSHNQDFTFPSNAKIINFKQLSTTKQWQDSRSIPNADPYWQSNLLITYLTDMYDQEMISILIEETIRTNDFYHSLYEITGESIENLEELIINNYKK